MTIVRYMYSPQGFVQKIFYFALRLLQCIKSYARVDQCSHLVNEPKIFSEFGSSQDSTVGFFVVVFLISRCECLNTYTCVMQKQMSVSIHVVCYKFVFKTYACRLTFPLLWQAIICSLMMASSCTNALFARCRQIQNY